MIAKRRDQRNPTNAMESDVPKMLSACLEYASVKTFWARVPVLPPRVALPLLSHTKVDVMAWHVISALNANLIVAQMVNAIRATALQVQPTKTIDAKEFSAPKTKNAILIIAILDCAQLKVLATRAQFLFYQSVMEPSVTP